MTLYERIGGEPAVGLAVDRFYVRVLRDPLLAPFFRTTEIERLKKHQVAFISQVLGGPQKYSGATMSQAHARMNIKQQHFDAVATHLVEALRELKVSENIISEVAAALVPLRDQVVNTASVASS